MSTLGIILVIILVLAIVGVWPGVNRSVNWGPWPSGFVGLILLVVVIMLLTGQWRI